MLLDAIGAATETLVITYTGANEYSGQQRPPAVPLAELLDTLDTTTPARLRDHIVVHHPLQPFDVRNVEPGALVPEAPFSFDSTVLRAARAGAGERCEQPKFVSGPLPPPPREDVVLDDLTASSATRSRASSGRWSTPCRGTSRASTTPSRSTSMRWRSGRSATGCSTTCCAG